MSTRHDKEAFEDTNKADGLAKAEAMLHPVRIRIISALAGREMTTHQIGEALPDIAKASLYRHMNRLGEAGLLRVVRETPVRGTLEKVYAVQMEATCLTPQELAAATIEDHTRYFQAFTASLLAQFQAFARNIEAQERAGKSAHMAMQGMGYNTNPFYLTDEELQQTAEEIAVVLRARRSNTPGGERRRRLISLVYLPDDTPE